MKTFHFLAVTTQQNDDHYSKKLDSYHEGLLYADQKSYKNHKDAFRTSRELSLSKLQGKG